MLAAKFHLLPGLVALRLVIQGGEHRTHLLVKVGTDFPNQRLGFLKQLTGMDRPREGQEVQAPVEVFGTVAVGNAVLYPAPQAGQRSQVFQAIPGQLSA